MADLQHQIPQRSIRWAHVAVAALVTSLSAMLPSGMLWLCPLLLICRWGRRTQLSAAVGLSCAMVAFLAVAGTASTPGSSLALELTQPVVLAIAGCVFAPMLLRGYSLASAGLAAVAVAMLAAGLALAMFAQARGPAFEDSLRASVASSLDTMVAQMEQVSSDGDEAFSRTVDFVKEHALWVVYLAPGVLGLGLMFSLWLNLLVVTRLAPDFPGIGVLSGWRPPDEWIWGLIGGAILTLSRVTPLTIIGLNCLIVGAGAYCLSGVAVGSFAARRWGIPGWMFATVLGLLALTGGLPYLAFIGLLDFWLDFRKRWQASE